jgi:hypothetical protein
MITDRNKKADGLGSDRAKLSFWVSDKPGLDQFANWRVASGLDRHYLLPDNVWDMDCSTLFKPDENDIHSRYFKEQRTIELMRQVLRGIDRTVLMAAGLAPPPLGGVVIG